MAILLVAPYKFIFSLRFMLHIIVFKGYYLFIKLENYLIKIDGSSEKLDVQLAPLSYVFGLELV